MSSSTEVVITQRVLGGRYVNTADREITIRTTADHIGDYGDDAPRAVIDIPSGTTLRAADVDELIENLRTARRAL